MSPNRSPKTTKPPSSVKTLSVASKIDFDSLENYFAGDIVPIETAAKPKDYKAILSEKHSSKPPAATTTPESDKSKSKTSPVPGSSESSSIMPLHSKVVVQKKSDGPVDERQKLSTLIKSIANSDAMNKRTTLLLDPSDPKRPKMSTTTSSALSSPPPEPKGSSPPLSPLHLVEIVESPTEAADTGRAVADVTSDDDQDDEDDDQSDSRKAKDPRSVYDNIRDRLQKTRASKVKAAPTPVYLEKLKTMKSRESAQFFQTRKLPKKAPQLDLNLTQCLNQAKQEHERRLEAKPERDRMMEASRATAPGGPLSKLQCFGRPSNEVARSKSVSVAGTSKQPSVALEPQKFKQPLSVNAKQNDNGLAKKDSEAERLLRHHEILKKMQKTDNPNKEPPTSLRPSNSAKASDTERRPSSSSVASSTRTTKETKENDLVGQIMNNMNKQAAQMSTARHADPARPRTSDRVQFEEFIYHVVSWSYNWLMEQEKHTEPPPITKSYQAMPMIDNYVVFSDYYKAMFPLLLYETWEEIYREYKEMTHKKERRTYQDMPLWYRATENCPEYPKMNIIRAQTIVGMNTKGFPNEDDLLRLCFDIKTPGKEGPYQALGIVHKVHKYKPDEGPVMQVVKGKIRLL